MSKRKKHLERKLRSYRSARFGSIFLAIMFAFVLLTMVGSNQTKDDLLGQMYAAACVWPALAYICHLKMKLLRLELSKLTSDGSNDG